MVTPSLAFRVRPSNFNHLTALVKSVGGGEKFQLCSRCNTKLLETDPAEAEGHVPEYVLHSQKKFLRCPSCHRFYWRGTHLERMNQYLESCVRPSNQCQL